MKILQNNGSFEGVFVIIATVVFYKFINCH